MKTENKRLKWLFVSAVGGSWGVEPGESEVDMPCIRGTDFDAMRLRVDTSRAPTRGFTSKDLCLRGARNGDLIIEKSGGGEQQPVGRAVLWDGAGVVMPTNFAARLRVNSATDSRFATYLLASMWSDGRTRAAIKQTTGIQNLDLSALLDQRVACPPTHIQRGISDYLDEEITRIDALVKAKRRMVELLAKALMSRIETTLCQPGNALIPMRRLLTVPPQYGAAESGHLDRTDWPRYIRITDLSADGRLRANDRRTLAPTEAKPYLLQDWDILFARSGATVGKAFTYRASMGPSCFAGYLIRFRFDSHKILPGLVDLWTRTHHYWSQIGEAALQATIENVSAEKYKDLIVPVPPPMHQQGLLSDLSWHRERTELVQSHLRNQINLLAERRQAIIAATVTGAKNILEQV